MRALAVALLLTAIVAPWTNILQDNADGAGMLAHLQGLFVTRDLLYDDEYAALGVSPLFAFVSSAGRVSNHWPMAASFLQAPGWLLGRWAGELLGLSARATTWTLPLLALRGWALLVLTWTLARIHRWLHAHGCRPGLRALTIAGLGLGTPLLYYAAEAPMRPHLWGAAVVAVFVMRWFDACERASRDPERASANWIEPALLALLAGLAGAIRMQLLPLCLLVAHERWLATAELPLGRRLKTLALHGLLGAGLWALWPLLIWRVQVWMYGDPSTAISHAPQTLHLRAFLLSTHHGALVWCPIIVLGLLGLAIGAASRARGALLLLGLFALQIWLDAGTRELEPYAVLGTRTWTAGTAFGPRKLVDALPLLLPGVIWIARWLDGLEAEEARRWRRRLAISASLALVPTTLLLIAAWLDPHTTSAVLDAERLVIAMGLAFDPSAWTIAWAQRALPLRIGLVMGAGAILPLAALGCAAWAISPGPSTPPAPSPSRRDRLAVGLGLALTLAAHAWMSHLIARSEAALAAEPRRMANAAARMNPWHEAMVAEVPRHHALLRERLGDDAVD
ncbi:hypothetical protein G6O69_35495 [Pseudenhygromyxa sp. WMMC2535]|uniref:hypothetical protein n=1 Tax=Pseudenhygromyxa sp. WMMC2535 TaxID=2712867 RepID=UPI00155741C7|nr:hypothetical protein [Pseudenhygromyxa sp. WMMC2535]NVB43183.1 hypothetical protein [Pseudenhygromyxa sp. WMMC2535]